MRIQRDGFLVFVLLITVAGCDEAMEQARGDSSEGVVPLGAVTLTYVTHGTGPDCIVVGVPPLDARGFGPVLESHLRCAYVTTRMSEPSLDGAAALHYDLATLLDELDQVRNALGLESVVVVGHSVHGTIALEYARAYPERVTGVIAVGAPPTLAPTGEEDAFWAAQASTERKAIHATNLAKMPQDSVDALAPGERFIASYIRNGAQYWADPTFDATPLWVGVTVNIGYLNALYATAAGHDIRTTGPIAVPVFLALGRHDYVVPFTMWDNTEALFDNRTLHVFEESGHWPHFEQPDAFEERLVDWFAHLSGGGAG